MPDKERPTVPEAVQAFLIVCADAPDIHERLDRFIAKCQNDKRWTTSEVDQIYRQILERLSP